MPRVVASRHHAPRGYRRAGMTYVELLLWAAFAAFAVKAILPDVMRVREDLVIEKTAWTLRQINGTVRRLKADGDIESSSEATLEMVEEKIAALEREPLKWPPQADLSTLTINDGSAGATVETVLPSGERRRLRAADLPETCIR